ncbi:MAG: hypothetical protein AW07_03792 [Candidatus Accumulibacter sp. SK-11]|nr:MAG: hypothetical protein AW07_03792 [Candidatus Accumulibacter sp. SK-11]
MPICRLIRLPAISTALKTRRIAKPIARPISICCASSSRPSPDPGATAGSGGSAGAMAKVRARPAASRTRAGSAGLLNGGAVASSARTRASGKKKAATQALISALLRLIIGCQPISCGMLSKRRRT